MSGARVLTSDRQFAALQTDIPGCAWAFQFGADGVSEAGSPEDLAKLPELPDGSFVWVHFQLPDTRVGTLLKSVGVLSDDARDALVGVVDHQYVEHAGNIVFGALIDHETTMAGRTYDTNFLRFALARGYLFTARRVPLQGTQATHAAIKAGRNVVSPVLLFEMIVENISACVAKMNREIADKLDAIEDRVILDSSGREQRAPLGKIRRDAVRLARQVGGLNSTMLRLEEAAGEPDHKELYDVATRLAQRSEGLSRDIANLQDRARLLQDEVNAILTMETNDRLYLLTIVTTLILPATFVTGYFGMNTKQLLFSEDDNGTIYATVICVLASLLALFLLRRFGLAQPIAAKDEARPKEPTSFN